VKALTAAAGALKILALWLSGKRVGREDYAADYDEIASGYSLWTDRMGKHTLRILPSDPGSLPREKPLRIVDLCCGPGFLSRALLGTAGPAWSIVGVDVSRAMIDLCRTEIPDPRCSFIASDARAYLESLKPGSVDAVFCGWGLVYLESAAVIRAVKRALVPGGIGGFIMNRSGTLAGVERIVVSEMLRRPSAFSRVMDIRFAMPSDLSSFLRRFTREGFTVLDSGEGEETAAFGSETEFRAWLLGTGALAGVFSVFPEIRRGSADSAREAIMRRIAAARLSRGSYSMNHRFVRGIFRKGAD
jgi:ubiquinone/menaquinone biosynthesis C-methylase UbiE